VKLIAPIDISRNELLNRQMEQFFRVTTDAILFLDRDYNFTFLNRHASEILTPAGTDLVGRNMYELFPAALDEGAPFAEAYRNSMERGISSDFEAFYGPPLNRWFRIQSHGLENGMMIVFGDVTQQHQDREALQRKTEEAERQHAELLTIYSTAPIGLALFDLDDYHYLRLNDRQAAFFGLKPEDVVGKTLTQMAPIEGLRELFDQVARGEPVINYPLEGTLVTDPSEYRYWAVSYFPVYGPHGEVQAITAASQEITAQKKAEQALLQSEKLAVVGRLASSIAHEINNPLEAVTNLLYLARYSETLSDAHGYIDRAEIELRRAAAITTQTLRFHKQSTSPQEVDLNSLIAEVLSIYQGRINNAQIVVAERLSASRKLRCFDGEIRQVISNLIGNALDAMPIGGRLQLRSRESTSQATGKRGITLTIADSGTGMSQHTLAKLFNAFFTTKGVTGTGLGLWVSHSIMDRHNGAIHVRSSQSREYHGTTFTLFLPFDTTPLQQESPQIHSLNANKKSN
jgi:PAS domain S-box-containing protein